MKIGLAVSGGIDSCYLMHFFARNHGFKHHYCVLTVDHNLRPESRDEALWVKQKANDLGLETHILTIGGIKPKTAIQNFARNARYQLLVEAAHKYHLDHIYLGHHQDDQAETILSRLNHDTGLSGLCAMADMFYYNNICFQRPLLNMSRAQILQSMAQYQYINDPSNDNEKYERVRNRKFLSQNKSLSQALILLSNKARSLYMPIYMQRNIFLQEYAVFHHDGYCTINREAFDAQDKILQEEILKFAIKYATGNFYIKKMPHLKGKNFTISNAEICFNKRVISIFQENRNIIPHEPKRFKICTSNKPYEASEETPLKARRSLPKVQFDYRPHALNYFVNIWDWSVLNANSKIL